jgi:hypothetical protein
MKKDSSEALVLVTVSKPDVSDRLEASRSGITISGDHAAARIDRNDKQTRIRGGKQCIDK